MAKEKSDVHGVVEADLRRKLGSLAWLMLDDLMRPLEVSDDSESYELKKTQIDSACDTYTFGLMKEKPKDDLKKFCNYFSDQMSSVSGSGKAVSQAETKRFVSFVEIYKAEMSHWIAEIKKRISLVFLDEQGPDEKPGQETMVKLDQELLYTTLAQLLAISLPELGYDARMSFLMEIICNYVGLDRKEYLVRVEERLKSEIEKSVLEEQKNLESQKTKKAEKKKKWMLGIGLVAGGLLVGATAGMAAPVVLPAFASLLGLSAAATALITGATGVAMFTLLFGAAGAGTSHDS